MPDAIVCQLDRSSENGVVGGSGGGGGGGGQSAAAMGAIVAALEGLTKEVGKVCDEISS